MKLSLEQIKSVLFGANYVTEEGGILAGHRFSPEILDAWGNLHEVLRKHAVPPTGVRLDFETDAAEIAFTVQGKPFELQIDGLYLCRSELSETPVQLPVTLDGGMHRVTLIFPFQPSHGELCGVVISDGAAITPHEYGEKFLFYGDSITQGTMSEIDSLCYVWQVAKAYNADFMNMGVGGACFDASVFEAPADFDPDRVFLAFGTNDFNNHKTPESLRKATSDYLDKVTETYGDKKIYGILPAWRSDSWVEKMGTFDECRVILRSEYEKRGITVFDAMKMIPHDKEFFYDRVHPNTVGFYFYSQNLIKALRDSDRG